MTKIETQCYLQLLIGILLMATRGIKSIPVQLTVNQRQTECMYERLNTGEKVTMSVFVLSGPELKATVSLEGPIAALDTNSGIQLHSAGEGYPATRHDGHLTFSQVVSFEHLTDVDDDASSEEDSEDMDQKDIEPPIDPNDPDAAMKRKQRREKQRETFLAAKQKRDTKRLLQQKKLREDGDPFTHTVAAPVDGWYRGCVQGTWYQVVVEMEMRKESDLGALDEEGDVITYEEKMMGEEDEELEKDTASEEGIKDQDFQETRDKMKDLRRLLNEIQSLQQKERRRLTIHAETNEHSHSRMVMSSLLETLVFMLVTGFQVYTIRKWFNSAPVLVR